MTIAFITGATGFVGAHLVRLLLQQGYEVRALVRPASDRRNLPQSSGLRVVEGDLRDLSSIKMAMRGCAEVYHLAADYRFWSENPQEIYDSNVRGTENILRAAGETGALKIVHTSTVGTIGLQNQPEPSNEKTPQAPGQLTSHYKRSKHDAEILAFSYAVNGLPVIIVNPGTPIGAWDRKPTPTGKMIVDFVNRRMPAYIETGLSFVPVQDVARGHWLAAHRGKIGERYILGGKNLRLQDFLKTVALQSESLRIPNAPKTAPNFRIPYCIGWMTGLLSTGYSEFFSRNPPSVPLDAVKMSRRTMFFDSTKAIQELGYTQTPIEEAVSEALHWFAQNGYFKSLSTVKKGDSYASSV